MDFNNKISDTSLFAELVKDKHKRDKVLQELKERRDDAVIIVETTTPAATAAAPTSGVDPIEPTINKSLNQMSLDAATVVAVVAPPTTNGGGITKDGCLLVDIPMPRAADVVDGEQTVTPLIPHPPLPADDALAVTAAATSANHHQPLIPVINSSAVDTAVQTAAVVIKSAYAKPRNLTKLPMPPGVSMSELEDTTTPSPPRSISPLTTAAVALPPPPPPVPAAAVAATTTTQLSGSSKLMQLHPNKSKDNVIGVPGRKGLLTLPMPPMVPGSEDLSGDDDIIGSPSRSPKKDGSGVGGGGSGGGAGFSSSVKRKRPTILNRRNSRSALIKDWGERCVDVFQVIAQIGEGTYGQVSQF